MAENTSLTVVLSESPFNRLDKVLSRDVPEDANLSRSRLAKLIAGGMIKLNGSVETNQKAKVSAGDQVEITVPVASVSHIEAEDIPLTVVFEDDELIVINKAAGMVVHPAPGTPSGTLVNALMHYCGDSLSGVGGVARPGIVHRIDKETSGLLVVAKTDAAHQGLALQFEKHKVERRYLAVVYGAPDASDPRVRGVKGVNFEAGNIMRITTNLARHKTDRQRQAVLFGSGRHAVTRSRIIETFGTPVVASLIECWLETGRTHQIRVHMAHAGHGLIGDPTYGGRRKLSAKSVGETGQAAARGFARQALHAATLGFVHPVRGENMEFEAEMPDDMAKLITDLGKGPTR